MAVFPANKERLTRAIKTMRDLVPKTPITSLSRGGRNTHVPLTVQSYRQQVSIKTYIENLRPLR